MNLDNNSTVSELYITQKVDQSLPIDDLMAWLIKEHPEAELKQILALLNVIYQNDYHITPGKEQKTYQVGERELTAYSQRVEAKSG